MFFIFTKTFQNVTAGVLKNPFWFLIVVIFSIKEKKVIVMIIDWFFGIDQNRVRMCVKIHVMAVRILFSGTIIIIIIILSASYFKEIKNNTIQTSAFALLCSQGET